MASEYLVMFWGLLPMVVPLVAEGLGGGKSRVDRFFFAIGGSGVLLIALALLVPRGEVPPLLAVVALFCASGIVALAYMVLVPSSRRLWPGLLAVLSVVDVVVLLAGYFGRTANLGIWGLTGLLVISGAVAGNVAVWAARRLGRARDPHQG
jgi:hypothetical protein